MRDILSDLEAGNLLSHPDPIRRAQIQMATPLPKRFYREAGVSGDGETFSVALDGRLAKTPGGRPLALPTHAAAKLVADEFAAQVEVIDPVTMPTYRLANSAIDGVARDPRVVLEDVCRYASSDLVCYRADGPDRLVARQAAMWDPVLDWARQAIGARFYLAEGIVHVTQPPEALEAVRSSLMARPDPVRVAGLHVMTAITGSALIAMMVERGAISIDEAWAAAHVDEDWNVDQWGEDTEALARRQHRYRDFAAASTLLEALPA